ncbi:hypothetical protein ACWGLF_07660 [Streptomyces puniciscabiei]
MNTTQVITLLTGLVTALVALIGYWVSQHQKRRERRADVFASALEAIQEYEQTPYLIRRREGPDAATRARISERLSASAARRRYHEAVLTLDSPIVAASYRALLVRTRRQVGPYRSDAWKLPVIASDEEFPGSAYYAYDNEPEWDLCLLAMRRELSVFAAVRRRDTRRRLEALIASRSA